MRVYTDQFNIHCYILIDIYIYIYLYFKFADRILYESIYIYIYLYVINPAVCLLC